MFNKLPFTTEEFLRVFEKYNLIVWPMQIVLALLALLAIFLTIMRRFYSRAFILYILSFFWLWMGIVYQLLFFSAINKAAYVFGSLFIVQGVLFFITSVKRKFSFQFGNDIYSLASTILIVFPLVIYPLIGYFNGHSYPSSPTFGLPCPTAIFTLGILMVADRCPIYLLIIPVIWSVIGFGAALSLGIKEDMGLLLAGIITAILIPLKNKGIKLSNLA